MIYAIWNNKGGVGKTFLTFVMGCEYALLHPECKVVIIDLCPQANVSELVLGGNGTGSKNLDKLLNSQPRRKTIGGYFDERIRNPNNVTGNESWYSINPKQQHYNENMPENLYLVAGDPSLELQSQVINQISILSQPQDIWKNAHYWVKDMIQGIKTQLGDDTMFFLDCNPSFASYTELAVVAAERLIVPCSADGSSARAIDNIGRLIYGLNVPSQYINSSFHNKVQSFQISLPPIHIICLDRSTQYDTRPAQAFLAMFDEVKKRVTNLATSGSVPFSSEVEKCFIDIPDAHTVSVVISYLGIPISNLRAGRYNINGRDTQVNQVPLERYSSSIQKLIASL